MLTILALTYLRFGDPEKWFKYEWEISKMGSDGRLSLAGFVETLKRRLEKPITLRDFCRWLFSDYVILQHQMVATSKLPDNTFRFQQEGDRLNFFNQGSDFGPADSRFNALSTVVYDFGWCGKFSNSTHSVSAEGEQFLEEGDLV